MKDKQSKEDIAMEVLRDIALDYEGILTERQRAIDALTLFRDRALKTLEHIARKVQGSDLLKQQAELHVRNIKTGIKIHMG